MPAAFVVSRGFMTFLAASFILAIIPGPAVAYIVTRTLSQGRRAGLASVLGIALGNLGNAAAAAIGLAAILAASSTVFAAVRWAGAAYLAFLGIRALRTSRSEAASGALASARRVFRDGFVVALLNPKTALFFAALLPQFIDPELPALGQGASLAGVFILTAVCTDTMYVLLASALGGVIGRWAGSRRYGPYLTAASFIGLGLYAALANPRGSR